MISAAEKALQWENALGFSGAMQQGGLQPDVANFRFAYENSQLFLDKFCCFLALGSVLWTFLGMFCPSFCRF